MSHVCEYERRVAQAASSGIWSDQLRQHTAGCGECAAAASVAPAIRQIARTDERRHILPDPAVIWLKAQIFSSATAAERASRPLDRAQMFACFTVACGWAALLMWKWEALKEWAASFVPTHVATTAAGAPVLSMTFFAVVLTLALATSVVTVYSILAEE